MDRFFIIRSAYLLASILLAALLSACGGAADSTALTDTGGYSPSALKLAQASPGASFAGNGWYLDPAAGGTGMMFEAQNNSGFVAVFMYDNAGNPIWYACNGLFAATQTGYTFSGDLQQYASGQYLGGVYKAPTSVSVGTISITFTGSANATKANISLPGGRLWQTVRFNFNGLDTTTLSAKQPETGWFLNPAEGGRGFAMEMQNNKVFMAMFHYNANGTPTWNVVQDTVDTNGNLSNAVFQKFSGGQILNGPYQAPVGPLPNGTASMSFSGNCAGSLSIAGAPTIAMQKFSFGGLPAGAECRSTGGTSTSGNTLSGTAAIGAPISGTVYAIDVNGQVSPPAPTTGLGAFTVDVSGMTAPFILNIVGTANGKQVTLNSVATASGQTVNITPLTDLIVSMSAGQPAGGSLAKLCTPVNNVAPVACTSALQTAAIPANLTAALNAVKSMVAPINPGNVDPLNGAFVANGTGIDSMLDQILVSPADSQNPQATVTLIATNTQLGTVTLPATAGQQSTSTSTAPSAADLTKATAAATVLPEIRACLAALNQKAGTTVTDADVSPFIDSSFQNGASQNKAAILPQLKSSISSKNFSVTVAGLSPVNMEPLTSTEITNFINSTSTSTTSVADFAATRAAVGPVTFSSGVATSAWVQFESGSDVGNWKFIKTTDTSACAGGWKLAGFNHVYQHMNARISRQFDASGNKTYARYWAFHVNVPDVAAEGSTINQIDVRGAGLTSFGDFSANGVNASGSKLRLMKPTNGVNTVFQIADRDPTGVASPVFSQFYGLGEAIQSCQDLALAYPVPSADLSTSIKPGRWTSCVDETKVRPGKLRLWTLRAGGTEVKAFLAEVGAVPISKAFAIANEANIFPTLVSITPANVTALNLLKGSLDNQVTYNYTQGSAYGSKMDNCSLYVWNVGTQILSAEEAAKGKETSCTFSTSSLNALGSNTSNLFQFTGPATDAYVALTATVLGNQTGSSQPLPH